MKSEKIRNTIYTNIIVKLTLCGIADEIQQAISMRLLQLPISSKSRLIKKIVVRQPRSYTIYDHHKPFWVRLNLARSSLAVKFRETVPKVVSQLQDINQDNIEVFFSK